MAAMPLQRPLGDFTPSDFCIEWNAENQLVRVTKDSVEVATFAYDPLGRRVEKLAVGVMTDYIFDFEDVLRERTAAGALSFVHGPAADEPLASEDATGALGHIHVDGLGSVVKTTDAAGAITHVRRYTAFGQHETGEATGPVFTGRDFDSETGIYYYRARFYDPKLGRFISEDPIRYAGGINFFVYVLNNPSNATDPFGLQGVTVGRPDSWCATRYGVPWFFHEDGTRYAHCMASCQISRECGPKVAEDWGFYKEVFDLGMCRLTYGGIVNDIFCDSAFQDVDADDNARGRACPANKTCEEECGPLKNREGRPGPFAR